MKSQALQDLIKKIFSDESTRAQFETDPDSVMSQYSLSEQERTAMLNTYSQIGLNSSGSMCLEAKDSPMSTWY